jgi:predicted RNase H-like nuclease (RuvC/YqgF family)
VKVKGGKKIKVIRSFSRNAILDTDRKYGLKRGDIVFLEDGSGGGASTAELLASKGVAAVIYGKELSHFAADKFFESGIPAFSTGEIPLLLKEESEGEGGGDFAFVDERLLNGKLEERKRKREKRREKYRTLYFK